MPNAIAQSPGGSHNQNRAVQIILSRPRCKKGQYNRYVLVERGFVFRYGKQDEHSRYWASQGLLGPIDAVQRGGT